MSSFDLRRLRYFVAIAELGSLTRAANALHVTQPALSHHIHELEEELGTQLFTRGSQGVCLTDTGTILADESRLILGSLLNLRNRLKDNIAGTPEGIVVVGVAHTIGLMILPQLLEQAAQTLPRVQVQIREVMSADVPGLIRSAAIDFAISYSIPSVNGITSTEMFLEDLFLFGTRAAAEARFDISTIGNQLSFAALEGVPLYLSAPTIGLRDCLDAIAKSQKIELDIVAEIDSGALRKRLALSGGGFTILSSATIGADALRQDVFVIRIVDPPVQRKVCFSRRSSGTLSRASLALASLASRTLISKMAADKCVEANDFSVS
jgi:LysR family nitrogen assimilation transcriptional regulator